MLLLYVDLSFWRETSQSPGTFIVDQPTNDRPLAEELKYSCTRAWQHQHPTNNLLEVWKNVAIFGGRWIGGAVEVLLIKVINRRSSVSPLLFFSLPPAPCTAVSMTVA
jgi:hypothetical protein